MPLYFLLAAALVAVDQVVKYLVRAGIPLHAAVDFLPGLDLTYVQNTGAAFSLFSQHTWLLTLLSGVVSVVLVICLGKESSPLVGDAGPGPSAGRGRGELH
ncbi:MAG: signal peptidase II [Evtepia gabavorous]